MGPQSASGYPGRRVGQAGRSQSKAGEAGGSWSTARRGKGYISVGSDRPRGRALHPPLRRPHDRNSVDFFGPVEAIVRRRAGLAVVDHRRPSGTDALLFALAHRRGRSCSSGVCGVPQPDRAVVEDPAVAGNEGPAVESWPEIVRRSGGRRRTGTLTSTLSRGAANGGSAGAGSRAPACGRRSALIWR